jgi:hypothetical protein
MTTLSDGVVDPRFLELLYGPVAANLLLPTQGDADVVQITNVMET